MRASRDNSNIFPFQYCITGTGELFTDTQKLRVKKHLVSEDLALLDQYLKKTNKNLILFFLFNLSMQAQINRITDILRRDDGISGAMHYTEQISWILFLKFLDDYESAHALESRLNGKEYTRLLALTYQRSSRAVPKKD